MNCIDCNNKNCCPIDTEKDITEQLIRASNEMQGKIDMLKDLQGGSTILDFIQELVCQDINTAKGLDVALESKFSLSPVAGYAKATGDTSLVLPLTNVVVDKPDVQFGIIPTAGAIGDQISIEFSGGFDVTFNAETTNYQLLGMPSHVHYNGSNTVEYTSELREKELSLHLSTKVNMSGYQDCTYPTLDIHDGIDYWIDYQDQDGTVLRSYGTITEQNQLIELTLNGHGISGRISVNKVLINRSN